MPDPVQDERRAKAAYERIEASVMDMAVGEVKRISLDRQATSTTAQAVVEALKNPEVAKRFELLDPELFDQKHREGLEDLAWGLLHADASAKTEAAGSRKAQLPATLVSDSLTTKARMLEVAEYNLNLDPACAAELASIRSGQGHLDLASDLARLGQLYHDHATVLVEDKRKYRASDEEDAFRLSEEIYSALGSSRARDTWAGRASRVMTRLFASYDEIRAAAEFVFRADPERLALFPSLYTATREPPKAPVVAKAPEHAPDVV
ncbi:MAG: hypothetical protein HYV07_30495 [Deltaproteobacteria bacterium]|nr:hypothetical protein [Deltaproteobacteria bacterium]